MDVTGSSEERESAATFVGTLPPPYTGQTIATRKIVAVLRERCRLREIEIGSRRNRAGFRWRVRKGMRSLAAALQILFEARRDGRRLYMIANSAGGLWYDLAIAAAARARGYRVFLHHQVYSYVADRDFRFALLGRVLRADSVHVVLDEKMGERLRELYGLEQQMLSVSNVVAVDPFDAAAPARVRREPGPLRLGHISNLTMEKGLGAVIDVFLAMRSAQADVQLVVAGEPRSDEAARALAQVCAQHSSRVVHLGAVYGEEKRCFFQNVDVLLFPTRYRNEAQPLVVCEALLWGVPVLAYGRACIPALIGATGGTVVPPEADFTAAVSPTLLAWSKDPRALAAAREAAEQRGVELRRDAELQLACFLDVFLPPSAGEHVHEQAWASKRGAIGGSYSAGSMTVSN